MHSSMKEAPTAPSHEPPIPAHAIQQESNVPAGSPGNSSGTPWAGNRVTHPGSTAMITITANDRETRDSGINDAVESMITHALQEKRCGILVTRHAPGHVSVRLSAEVPFGETHELAIC